MRHSLHPIVLLCALAFGCVEGGVPTSDLEPMGGITLDGGVTYPINACADGDPRIAPVNEFQETPTHFESGEYTFVERGQRDLVFRQGEEMFRLPVRSIFPDLVTESTYLIERSDDGLTLYDDGEFVVFAGASGFGNLLLDDQIDIAPGLQASVEFDCDDVSPWADPNFCGGGYTIQYNLVIDDEVYPAGEHDVNIDGKPYRLIIENIAVWNPIVPGSGGCPVALRTMLNLVLLPAESA